MDLFAPLTSIFFAVVAYVIGSVKVINEGEQALVERFGRYRRTLAPGLNFTLPIVDTIIIDTTREQVFDVPPQEAVTADGVSLQADAVVFWQVSSLYRVHYEVDDVKEAIETLVLTTLRTQISRMSLTEVFSARSSLGDALLNELNQKAADWGVDIRRVDVKDIKASQDVMKGMERARIAADNKKAAILDAEGKRQAAIEEAESRREAAIAEAQGIAEAVQMIAHAVEANPDKKAALSEVVKFLVAQRYVDASQKIGESQNSKVIFMDPRSFNDSLDELVLDRSGDLPGAGRVQAE